MTAYGTLNGVRFTPTTGGTTDWTYSAAVTGFNSPALGNVQTGIPYVFRAESADFSQWELCAGTYSGGVFARTEVLQNSSGTGTMPGQSGAGTKINFTLAPTVTIVATRESFLSMAEAISFTDNEKAQGRANLGVLKHNYIINGAMMVSQENGTTAGTVTGYYAADTWRSAMVTGGTWTFAQVASVTNGGSPNRIRVTVTAADAAVAAGDIVVIGTDLEGLRTVNLRLGSASAKTVTLQFGVKAPAGTYGVVFQNSAQNRSYTAEFVISGGEANTDVIKSVTVALDQSGTWLSDTNVGIRIFWTLMGGTTFQGTVNTWNAANVTTTASQFNFMGTNGNVFELFDVSLTEGSVAPAFQVPEFPDELFKCQRYFCKWGVPYETAAADAASLMTANGVAVTTTLVDAMIVLPNTLRADPTVTFYRSSSGASAAKWSYFSGSWVDASAQSIITQDRRTMSVRMTVGSVTAGAAFICAGNAKFSARL